MSPCGLTCPACAPPPQTEFDELLLCLGMESAKNQALCDAMRAAGLDPEPILRAVEEQWMEENMSG